MPHFFKHPSQTPSALPVLVFYDHHLQGATTQTIRKLLPALSELGYTTLCFEPDFNSGSLEDELRVLERIRQYYLLTRDGSLKSEIARGDLMRDALTMNFNLLRMDLPLEEFQTELLHLCKTLFPTFNSDGMPPRAKDAIDYLVKQGCQMDPQFFTHVLEYFAATETAPDATRAAHFFNRRTQAMQEIIHHAAKDAMGGGVIALLGYNHQLAHSHSEPVLSFFCEGQNEGSLTQLPSEKRLSAHSQEFILQIPPGEERMIIKAILEIVPERETDLLEDYFSQKESGCCRGNSCQIL